MGRPVHVDLRGMDTQIAREHAEGLLRGAEKFPNNELGEVTTFGAKGALPASSMGPSAHADGVTTPGITGSHSDRIAFNVDTRPAAYRAKLQRGRSVPRDPTGVAMHEFGHVATVHNGSIGAADRIVTRHADAEKTDFFDFIKAHISPYAAGSEYEMTAEAFTDAMMNGSKASAVSREIFAAIQGQHGQ